MLRSRRFSESAYGLGSCLFMAGVLCCGAALAQPGSPVVDPYVQLLAQAQRLDARGDVAGAAALLARAEPSYPDDFLLHLRLAYARFRLGQYRAALIEYRHAETLSGGQRDAELGLGFTLQRLGRCDAARQHFEAVLERAPDDAAAQQGLALCALRAPMSLQVEAKAIVHAYVDHPVLSYALGAQVALDGHPTLWSHLGGLYRGTQFWSARGVLGGGRRALTLQHELYLVAGLQSPRVGGDLRYAYVGSSAQSLSRAHVVGLTAWGWPLAWLGLWLEASASFYEDVAVARAQPGISLWLGRHFGVRPSLGLQQLQGVLLAAAELELSVRFAPIALFVGGRVGEQRRPSFLSQPTVYNTDDVIGDGTWAALELAVSQVLSLGLSYELQLRNAFDPYDGSRREAIAHYAVLALRFERE